MRLQEFKLNQFEPTQQQREFLESFIVVRKSSPFFKLNYKYTFRDYTDRFIGIFYLVSIQQFKISEVTAEQSFLHKNTTVDIYKEILEYHNFKEKDNLYRMVFTNQKQFSKDINLHTEINNELENKENQKNTFQNAIQFNSL